MEEGSPIGIFMEAVLGGTRVQNRSGKDANDNKTERAIFHDIGALGVEIERRTSGAPGPMCVFLRRYMLVLAEDGCEIFQHFSRCCVAGREKFFVILSEK